MAQDPFTLARYIQKLVRDFPIGAKAEDIEHLLRDALAVNGYTVPQTARYADAQDPEHDGITRFRLEPTVAAMSVGDVKALIETALKDHVSPRRASIEQIANDIVRTLT